MSYAFAKNLLPTKPPGNGSMPASAFKRYMRDFMKAVGVYSTKRILNGITDANKVDKNFDGYALQAFIEIYNISFKRCR